MHYFSLFPATHIAIRHSYAKRHLVNIAQTQKLISSMCCHVATIAETQKLNCVAGAEFCTGGSQNWLPYQRLLTDRKTDFGSFFYSRNSTKSANLANTDPADVEIIGLAEIVKSKL